MTKFNIKNFELRNKVRLPLEFAKHVTNNNVSSSLPIFYDYYGWEHNYEDTFNERYINTTISNKINGFISFSERPSIQNNYMKAFFDNEQHYELVEHENETELIDHETILYLINVQKYLEKGKGFVLNDLMNAKFLPIAYDNSENKHSLADLLLINLNEGQYHGAIYNWSCLGENIESLHMQNVVVPHMQEELEYLGLPYRHIHYPCVEDFSISYVAPTFEKFMKFYAYSVD